MIREILSQGCYLNDIPVCISGEIKKAKKKSPSVRLINKLESDFTAYTEKGRIADGKIYLKKSGLLAFWNNTDIPFEEKILLTILWGHPNHSLTDIYSCDTLERISHVSPLIARQFDILSQISSHDEFEKQLVQAFRNFEKGGDWYIPQIGISFFTKFFHFYFASHPIRSKNCFLPVIADKWMLQAVYAEMVENRFVDRTQIIEYDSILNIRLKEINGSFADSYIKYVEYYNEMVNDFVKSFPTLTPFLLEDILFSRSRNISSFIISKDFRQLYLPPWISGRYTKLGGGMAIIYNNLSHQEFLFKKESAKLIGSILDKDYYETITPSMLSDKTGIAIDLIIDFIPSLLSIGLLVDHYIAKEELNEIKQQAISQLRKDMNTVDGSEKLPSTYEMADAEYRKLLLDSCLPYWVSLEITYGCNENCIHCYNPCSPRDKSGVKKAGNNELTFDDYRVVLDQLADMGVVKLLFTGGDPFVKKDFIKILRYAHEKKFTTTIYTNGQSLFSRPDFYNAVVGVFPYRVGLSIYSMDEKKHEAITRVKGSLKKTINVANRLFLDGVVLEIKCPVMRSNYIGYSDVYEFSKSICGITEFELNITSGNDGDTFAVNNLRLKEEDLKSILRDSRLPLSLGDGALQSPDRTPDMPFCNAGSDSFNINPDGDVYPCLSFPMPCGNVKESTIRKIWSKSGSLKKTRRLKYGDSDECGKYTFCKYCNRCIGQSYIESGCPVSASTDNCFIAKIREQIANEDKGRPEPISSGN